MIASLQWLKDYTDINVPVEEFLNRMIMSGSDLETCEEIGTGISGVKLGRIDRIEKHPDAEKLYIETLDDGSGEERVIVSGLVPYFAPEELLGKSIIIADNLKPRKMRGVESRGMLLAGDYTDAEGKERVEVLDSSWAKPGTPVVLEGDFPPCEKPDVIDADTFFSAPMEIRDFTVQINGIRLLIDGRPVRLQNIKEGSVS